MFNLLQKQLCFHLKSFMWIDHETHVNNGALKLDLDVDALTLVFKKENVGF